MDDMQLLELSSKASGFVYTSDVNPLVDDALALRLAVKLSIWIGHHEDGVTASDTYSRFNGTIEEDYGSDPYAATRRCIVMAAAAIGEKMP